MPRQVAGDALQRSRSAVCRGGLCDLKLYAQTQRDFPGAVCDGLPEGGLVTMDSASMSVVNENR